MVKAENKIHTEASKPIVRGLSLSSSSGTAASSEKGVNKKKYKGVRMRSWGSWVSEIRAPNQKTRIWLGSYSTAEAAARAYDAALLCLKGSSASLNFPSTSSLYINQDITPMSPKSIQRVAAAAANTFVDNNNNDIIAIPTTPPSPPSPPLASITSSSNSLVSSPSIASSPSDQIDDDVSLLSPLSLFGAYTSTITTRTSNCDQVNESMAMMESWYGLEELQSPKYVDQMLSGAFFDIDSTNLFDDLYEESDIRLWSFS